MRSTSLSIVGRLMWAAHNTVHTLQINYLEDLRVVLGVYNNLCTRLFAYFLFRQLLQNEK